MRRRTLLAMLVARPGAFGGDRRMTFPGKEWARATPESQGVSGEKLAAAVEYLERRAPRDGVKELAIVRYGRMIHAGPEIDKMHGVWSCTKSFTSTALGLSIDDGKCALDTRVKDVLPTMARDYPDVTLRHFTTMTSGYRAEGDEPQGNYRHGPSRTPFRPGPPLFRPPGSRYAYWDSAMNQFANALTRIAGEPIEELFRRRIAEPIGMNPQQWDWGDFGEVDGIVVNGGSGNGHRHVSISAREMARFGHLFLNGGEWAGRRLIGGGWVEQATRTQVAASTPLGHPESGIDGPGMYGYNWWTNGVKPNGKRKWEGVPGDAFAASGHNNNDMFVIPSWSVVAARLGLDQEGEGGFAITDDTYAGFLRLLGEALR
ncbi:MAG: serine hydrolase [Bryobacteraceae bacterium]|nr:serine hydrolase [Bryobacteraceae bacterium]